MLLKQVLAELYHCCKDIAHENVLLDAAENAASSVDATIVDRYSVSYQPHGLTVAVFLAESHIVLTTWPEYDLVLVDTLLCNPDMSHKMVIEHIRKRICPDGKIVLHSVNRLISSELAP